MRRRGRWRRWAKWAGVVACAVILTAWGVSLFYGLWLPLSDHVTVASYYGRIELLVTVQPNVLLRDAAFTAMPSPVFWLRPSLPARQWMPDMTIWQLFYSFLLLLVGLPTALLFFFDRRKIRPGHCKQCGYDLQTMSDGRCPECGTAAAAQGAS